MRWMLFIACVTACATTKTSGDEPMDDSRDASEAPPADGGPDSNVDADAGPCTDCEYFPDVCSAAVLCPNGPFDPSTSGGGLDARLTINVIRGRSIDDIWAAGSVGAIAHFDGASWARSDLGRRESLHALWLRASGEVALAALSRAYTRNLDVLDGGAVPSAGGWTFHPTLIPAEHPSLSNAAFACTGGASDGEWLWCAFRSTQTTGLWRMRLLPSSILEVQAGVPTAVCKVNSCTLMKSIHRVSADALWAVGESGSSVLITDADGATPSAKAFNTQTWMALNGVWGASASDAWAVGAGGTVLHYTGDPMLWNAVTDVPAHEDLRAVWGFSSTDVWAVGDAGVVLHYDGKSWSRVKIAGLGMRRPNLTTVWGAAPGHVWVGGQGVILSIGGKP